MRYLSAGCQNPPLSAATPHILLALAGGTFARPRNHQRSRAQFECSLPVGARYVVRQPEEVNQRRIGRRCPGFFFDAQGCVGKRKMIGVFLPSPGKGRTSLPGRWTVCRARSRKPEHAFRKRGPEEHEQSMGGPNALLYRHATSAVPCRGSSSDHAVGF